MRSRSSTLAVGRASSPGFRAFASLLAFSLLAAGALDAQRGSPVSDRLPGRVVDVAAGEFFFQSPDSIPAGLTTFRLRQIGLVHHRVLAGGAALDSLTVDRGDQTRGFHMLWLVRLDEGRTMSDFYRAMQDHTPTPWAKQLGGPSFVMPPRTTNATLVLEPGRYVLACFVGSAREDRTRYHLLNGMFRELTVKPSKAPTARVPAPDVIARVSAAGAVHFSTPLTAGRHVIRVENAGAKGYEFQIRRVLPGRSMAEALAWRPRDLPTTPIPYESWGGLSDVPAGGALITTMTFEPGDYFVGSRVGITVLPARR